MVCLVVYLNPYLSLDVKQHNNLDVFCYTVNPLLVLCPANVGVVGSLPLYNTFHIIKTLSPLYFTVQTKKTFFNFVL